MHNHGDYCDIDDPGYHGLHQCDSCLTCEPALSRFSVEDCEGETWTYDLCETCFDEWTESARLAAGKPCECYRCRRGRYEGACDAIRDQKKDDSYDCD